MHGLLRWINDSPGDNHRGQGSESESVGRYDYHSPDIE